jgi:hypothetical protein
LWAKSETFVGTFVSILREGQLELGLLWAVTSQAVNSYTWDGANRLLSIGGASYKYDGEGRLIHSQTAHFYI